MLTVLISTVAQADRRVALVVGNSDYKFVPRIPNAQNDGRAMAELLRAEGFEVVDRQNLGNDDLRRTVRDFVEKTREADVAVVYFAGHGIEVDGANYLIPTDARLRTDLSVHDEALSLERVLQILEPARKLRLVILDACRDNPFVRTMARTVATRAVARGLAHVEPTRPNTLIAFAAKAGSVAEDGSGEHSPFTTALLNHVAEPGLDIRLALGRVRDEVLERTRNGQEPFVYGSLGGSLVALSAKAVLPAAPAGSSGDEARRDFMVAQKLGTLDGWDAFLSRYKDGYVADLARKERERLATLADRPATDAITPGMAAEIGSTFGPDDRERVAQIASRNRIPLPSFEITVPDQQVPPQFRRFVGVWASKTGYADGRGRQAMIITTSVTRDGVLRGYLLGGPPTPESAIQQPAFTSPFVARISGTNFSFTDAHLHKVELSTDGRLRMHDESSKGSFSIVLEPVWTAAAPAGTVVAAVDRSDLSGGATHDLPDEKARARISEVALRNKVPLGDYSFAESGRRSPDHLKKFIGVWASGTGFNGGPVQAMLIVTDVSETGQAEGQYLSGAIPPGSARSRPARNLPFQGPIDGQRLSFTMPRANFELTLDGENAFKLKVAEVRGPTSQIELLPVWTLLSGLQSPATSRTSVTAPTRAIEKRAAPAAVVAPAAAVAPANSGIESRRRGTGRGGGMGGGDIYDHPRFSTCARMANQRGLMGPGSGRRAFVRNCVTSG